MRRQLNKPETFVLNEIQAYWGDQNTIDDVTFTDRGEALLFVRARDGSSPVAVVLTNLGEWYENGTLSIDSLREHIKGPEGRSQTGI